MLEGILWTAVVVLVLAWAIGVLTSYTFGGAIHGLALAATVMIVVNLVRNRGVRFGS